MPGARSPAGILPERPTRERYVVANQITRPGECGRAAIAWCALASLGEPSDGATARDIALAPHPAVCPCECIGRQTGSTVGHPADSAHMGPRWTHCEHAQPAVACPLEERHASAACLGRAVSGSRVSTTMGNGAPALRQEVLQDSTARRQYCQRRPTST